MKTTKHYKDGRRVSIKMDYLELEQFKDGLLEWRKFYQDHALREDGPQHIWNNYTNEVNEKIAELEALIDWIQK